MQALPVLHVGTLWQGIDEDDVKCDQNLIGSEYDESFVKMNNNRNSQMKKKPNVQIRKFSTCNSRVNQGNASNGVDNLSDENDVSLVKKCQRKMSQTITSFHLSLPTVDRRRSSFSFKVNGSNVTLIIYSFIIKYIYFVYLNHRNKLQNCLPTYNTDITNLYSFKSFQGYTHFLSNLK